VDTTAGRLIDEGSAQMANAGDAADDHAGATATAGATE
jgi:hypothetical protein